MRLSEPALASLRSEFAQEAQFIDMTRCVESVRDVILAGAFLGGKLSRGPDHLSFQDKCNFILALTLMAQQGIFLDPAFTVDVVGMDYGEDFLEGTYKTDAVILCHILEPGSMRLGRVREGVLATSPHFDANPATAWHDSVIGSGAKVVFAPIFPTAIGPEFFVYPGSCFVAMPVDPTYGALLVRNDIAPKFGL